MSIERGIELRVLRLVIAGNEYQQLSYDLEEGVRLEPFLYRFNGQPKLPDWSPQPVFVHYPRLKQPDIWGLPGIAALAFDLETTEKLEPFLSRAGELLPIFRTQEPADEMKVLNVLKDIECLDVEKSVLGPVRWQMSFLEHRLPAAGLFKVPQSDSAMILCLERPGDESFRERVERRELKGLTFEEVWSLSAGATEFSLFRL